MNARDLGYVSLSVALISVSAWLGLPVGEIPVTLQTAMIFVTAGLLGWKRATLSVTAYLLLGFVGVPVFAGFTGGAGKILSPTGGYLVGFLPLAFSVGMASDCLKKKESKGSAWRLSVSMAVGLLACYVLGTAWFTFLSSQNDIGVGFWSALGLCVLPYLPFDLLKIPLAVYVIKKISKFINL